MTPLRVGVLSFDQVDSRTEEMLLRGWQIKSFIINNIDMTKLVFHVGQNQLGQKSNCRGTQKF